MTPFCEQHSHPHILVGWDEIDEEQFHSLIEVHACPFCVYAELMMLAKASANVVQSFLDADRLAQMVQVVGALVEQLEDLRKKDRAWQMNTPSTEGTSLSSPPTTCTSSTATTHPTTSNPTGSTSAEPKPREPK